MQAKAPVEQTCYSESGIGTICAGAAIKRLLQTADPDLVKRVRLAAQVVAETEEPDKAIDSLQWTSKTAETQYQRVVSSLTKALGDDSWPGSDAEKEAARLEKQRQESYRAYEEAAGRADEKVMAIAMQSLDSDLSMQEAILQRMREARKRCQELLQDAVSAAKAEREQNSCRVQKYVQSWLCHVGAESSGAKVARFPFDGQRVWLIN